MIGVYKQKANASDFRFVEFVDAKSGEDAVRHWVETGRLIPGDLAMTIHTHGEGTRLATTRKVKFWAIYEREGIVEWVPDRVGITLKPTDYRYYREYLKYGRVKSLWYRMWKK